MRDTSFGKLIQKSIDRTKLILFQPFHFKKWLALTLIALLAGGYGGGGFNGGGSGGRSREAVNARKQAAQTAVSDQNIDASKENGATTANHPVAAPNQNRFSKITSITWSIGLILFLILLLIFSIWLMWLCAPFPFIWFQAMVQNNSAIKVPYKQFRNIANSYFKWNLLILALSVIYFALITFVVFRSGAFDLFSSKISFLIILQAFWPLVALLVISVLALTFFYVLILDFVVPVMVIDSVGFVEGCKIVSGIYKANRLDIWLYLLVKVGIALVLGIAGAILSLGWILTTVLAALILIGIPYFIIAVLIKLKMLAGVIALSIGIPLIIVSIFALWFALLPLAVFRRSFSLYYLSSLKTVYTPLSLD